MSGVESAASPASPPRVSPGPAGLRGDRPVRVPKMAELVAGDLRRRIVRGELAADEALPSESALMARFEVSRPTLREAFRVLESESLITVRRGPRGGARVRPPSAEVAARYAGLILEHQGTTLADVLQVRVIVEPQAVGLLARNRTDADLARLRAALDRPASLTPVDPAGRAVGSTGPGGRVGHAGPAEPLWEVPSRLERFHQLLVELTGNSTLRVLMGMIENIVEAADRSRAAADEGSADLATAVRESRQAHARVVDLIEAGDADRAERLWRRHLEAASEYLVRGDATTALDLLG